MMMSPPRARPDDADVPAGRQRAHHRVLAVHQHAELEHLLVPEARVQVEHRERRDARFVRHGRVRGGRRHDDRGPDPRASAHASPRGRARSRGMRHERAAHGHRSGHDRSRRSARRDGLPPFRTCRSAMDETDGRVFSFSRRPTKGNKRLVPRETATMTGRETPSCDALQTHNDRHEWNVTTAFPA